MKIVTKILVPVVPFPTLLGEALSRIGLTAETFFSHELGDLYVPLGKLESHGLNFGRFEWDLIWRLRWRQAFQEYVSLSPRKNKCVVFFCPSRTVANYGRVFLRYAFQIKSGVLTSAAHPDLQKVFNDLAAERVRFVFLIGDVCSPIPCNFAIDVRFASSPQQAEDRKNKNLALMRMGTDSPKFTYQSFADWPLHDQAAALLEPKDDASFWRAYRDHAQTT